MIKILRTAEIHPDPPFRSLALRGPDSRDRLQIDGEPHSCVRLPSRTGNLRNDAGTTMPETAIAAHLGRLSIDD